MKAEVIVKAPGSGAWQELAYPLEAELSGCSSTGLPRRFDGLYGFDFRRHGEPAIIFKTEDRGDELDLIAWEASTGKLASWHGNTFCLGDLDQIDNPATYFMGGHFAFMPRRLSG